jgi:DNA replication protein DnaC
MSRVLDDIRLAFDEKENKTTELLRRMDWWVSRDVLFLDEIDKVNGTDWAEERIFQLLDQRYTRAVREEALTVIASNESDDKLSGYLGSRLRDSRLGPVVHLEGSDGRQSMPKGWKS